MVEQSCSRDIAMARSHEEKAVAALSGHKIAHACSHLLDGKNFHLATLIALIGENEKTRRDIREQLTDWQKSKMLPEISQPVRCLYELLAGNVSVCDGSKAGPVEDRMESFVISTRFGLDWRRAFGLRLWYAIGSADGLEQAVRKFEEDIVQDKEAAIPKAWYVEQGIPAIWNDPELQSRQDLLWGLLRLYSYPDADLESIIRPENSQLSPLNVRLSWQLSCALTAFDKVSYGAEADEKADQLALSFASQLTSEKSWLDAIFVLLHLRSTTARTSKIQAHLAQHADQIGSEDSKTFRSLVDDLKIPAAWIWEAKALLMRAVYKEPQREVEYLLRAGAFDEAHRAFSKEVAPKGVIERDFETMRVLLSGFKGRESAIKGWHMGGELYSDYLELLEAQNSGADKVDGKVVERLFAALTALTEDGSHAGFMEVVAAQEISAVIGRMVVEMSRSGQVSCLTENFITPTNILKTKNLSKVLGLPLTEDRQLKHTVDLSLNYYRTVMMGR